MIQTESKLRSFARLEKGWYHGEGKPCPGNVVESCVQVLHKVHALGLPTEAFFACDGSVQISAYSSPDYFQVERRSDGFWIVTHEFNDMEKFYQSGMVQAEVEHWIETYIPKILGYNATITSVHA